MFKIGDVVITNRYCTISSNVGAIGKIVRRIPNGYVIRFIEHKISSKIGEEMSINDNKVDFYVSNNREALNFLPKR
jgi:hypothetical protein